VKLAIGVLLLLTRVDRIFQKRDIITVAGQNMTIDRIVANIDLAVREPSMQVLVTFIECLCALFMPVDSIRFFTPVSFSIIQRGLMLRVNTCIFEVVSRSAIRIADVFVEWLNHPKFKIFLTTKINF
jgi:hypothetical protein